jgi:hypothetical protein
MKKISETREANRRESINDSIVLMKISLKMCNMSENNNESWKWSNENIEEKYESLYHPNVSM